MKFQRLVFLSVILAGVFASGVSTYAQEACVRNFSKAASDAIAQLRALPDYQAIADGIFDAEKTGDRLYAEDSTGVSVSVAGNTGWNRALTHIGVPLRPIYTLTLSGDLGNAILWFAVDVSLATQKPGVAPETASSSSGNGTQVNVFGFQRVQSYSSNQGSYGLNRLGEWFSSHWDLMQGLSPLEVEQVLSEVFAGMYNH